MDALRIQVPHELFAPAESSHFEGSIAIPVMKAGPDLYDFAGPLAWQADISNTGDALLVTGTVEGEAKTACARCLDEVSFPVTGEIEGYFLLDETKAAPEDMDEDEFDVLPADKVIDLEPLITAALLLEFPLIPLWAPAAASPPQATMTIRRRTPSPRSRTFPSTSRRTSFARPNARPSRRAFFFLSP